MEKPGIEAVNAWLRVRCRYCHAIVNEGPSSTDRRWKPVQELGAPGFGFIHAPIVVRTFQYLPPTAGSED